MTTTARTRQLVVGTPRPIRRSGTRPDLIKSLTTGGVGSLLVGAVYLGWLIHGRDTAALDPQIAVSERYWAEVMSNSAYGVIAIFLGGLALIAAAHIHLGNRQHQQRLDAAADIAARLARVQSQQAVQGDVTAKLAEMYLSVSSRLDEVMDTVVRADDQTRQILARLDAVARLDHTVRSTLRDASRAINKLTQRQQRAEARVQRIAQTVAGWEQDVGAVRDPGVVDMDTVRSMKSIEKRLSGRDPDVHPSES